MRKPIKKPIKKSLISGCILFILVLCIVLVSVCYSGYRKILFDQYDDSMSEQLEYVAAHIDVDDLETCIESGKKSEKFNQLQAYLDDFKEHTEVEFVYIIVPLNDNETDNIKSIIAGLSEEEYENEPEKIVELNSLSGDNYSAETASKYLEAYHLRRASFFTGKAMWGTKYTGVLPLYNTSDKKVAELCIDININVIHSRLYLQAMLIILITLVISIVFIILFIYWSDLRVTQPIQDLEESVVEFAEISHMHKSPDELVLHDLEIHTENEVESLSDAVEKMSEDIREYAKSLTEAEEASKQQSIILSEALEAAQAANRAKTAFLSNMSHEIRTPMNAIIGLDNIALHEPGVPASTRDHLEKIGSSAEHLLNLINEILDMSRIESGRMVIRCEEFSLSKTIAQVNTIIGGQCRDKGLTYECDILGDVDEYYIGDDMKIRQILINILGNSVKFTPEGGTIAFKIRRIGRFDNNAALRFMMQDTGVGMSPEFIPKIFESFSQEEGTFAGKYGSTGLGMAITKNLVDLMNGDIRVESEKGKGTIFTVTLTLQESGKNHTEIEAIEMDVTRIHALVIDDDLIACKHARLTLSHEGVECDEAQSGAEGLQMAKLRAAGHDPYDLILVDWNMPEMDGLETTRQIRAAVGSDPVIMLLTSYGWDDVMTEAIEIGVDSFLTKPLFSTTALREYRQAQQNRQGGSKPTKADLSGRRILVAEDVAINAQIMQMILSERGMTAEIAENGEIAVEMFSEHAAGHYDAILMDMRMPEMDGVEATGAIRALDREDAKEVPIIALTANAFEEDVRTTLNAGMNAHLTKPVDAPALYETLENLIKP